MYYRTCLITYNNVAQRASIACTSAVPRPGNVPKCLLRQPGVRYMINVKKPAALQSTATVLQTQPRKKLNVREMTLKSLQFTHTGV